MRTNKNTKKSKKRLLISILSAVVVMGMVAGFGLMLNVSAEKGEDGGMSTTTDGECKNCAGCRTTGTLSHYQDSCYGGCWSKGTIGATDRTVIDAGKGGSGFGGYGFINDSDPNKIIFGGNYNDYQNSQDGGNRQSITGGTLEGCGDLGATEFYYSAMTDFSLSDGKATSNGVQTGLLPAGKYEGVGTEPPGVVYNYNDTCGTSKLEIKQKYEIAKKQYEAKGQTLPDWNNLSGFCYNSEEWEKEDPDDPTPPEPDPDPEEPDDPSSEDLELKGFWSEAHIYIPEQDDIPKRDLSSENREEARQNSSVSIEFSTDIETVKFEIWHEMYYSAKLDKRDAWANHTDYDGIESVTSNYKVTVTGTENGGPFEGTVSSKGVEDTGCSTLLEEGNAALDYVDEQKQENGDDVNPPQSAGKVPSEGQNRTEFEVSLDPGQTITVCSKNEHDMYKLTAKRTFKEKVEAPQGEDQPSKYNPPHYETEFGDSTADGSSEACVTIYRANADPKEKPLGSKSTGTNNSTIMYAGEVADSLRWDNVAEANESRRIIGHKVVAYLLKTGAEYQNQEGNLPDRFGLNGADVGEGRVFKEPCEYYREKNNGFWVEDYCQEIPGYSRGADSMNETSRDSYGQSVKIKVPDYTGYKYCNTSGYEWRYYERQMVNGSGDWKEVTDIHLKEGNGHLSEGRYWTNYSSACRTIVKKPEVAFWNGGVKTTGGITTSLAPRYNPNDDANQRPTIAEGGNRNLFGSWTEYLAIANNTISGFASGAALSRDFLSADADIFSQASFLTIAKNSGTLGNAQINSNSALRTRLLNYLSDRAPDVAVSLASPSSVAHLDCSSGGKARIIANVDIITNNIEINGSCSDIYKIPRVIIYNAGDIKIDSGVDRVDAWIIAGRDVNTCSDFAEKTSETSTAAGPGNRLACNDHQLKINGPVIAGGVMLNRTYGADPVSYGVGNAERYTPAEIFSLGADDYLWAYAQAGRYNSSYSDAYTRELPPRY